MKFWKYEGIGNDFIILDGIRGSAHKVDIEMCKRICDRHFGIGADGVIYILPGSEGCDLNMRIINPDGSEAEMCGNGIRCLAKHAYDFWMVKKTKFVVGTLRGSHNVEVFKNSEGKAESVRADMGAPILECEKVPVDFSGERMMSQPIDVDGVTVTGSAVSMGNPHFVTFDDLDDKTIQMLAPKIERHPMFPRKTNVEFAKIENGKIYIQVFERGAGWTLACGTGACATTTVAALNGKVPFNKPVDVHLPGGWLQITIDKDLKYALMEGPASFIYSGDTSNRKIR